MAPIISHSMPFRQAQIPHPNKQTEHVTPQKATLGKKQISLMPHSAMAGEFPRIVRPPDQELVRTRSPGLSFGTLRT